MALLYDFGIKLDALFINEIKIFILNYNYSIAGAFMELTIYSIDDILRNVTEPPVSKKGALSLQKNRGCIYLRQKTD